MDDTLLTSDINLEQFGTFWMPKVILSTILSQKTSPLEPLVHYYKHAITYFENRMK